MDLDMAAVVNMEVLDLASLANLDTEEVMDLVNRTSLARVDMAVDMDLARVASLPMTLVNLARDLATEEDTDLDLLNLARLDQAMATLARLDHLPNQARAVTTDMVGDTMVITPPLMGTAASLNPTIVHHKY